MEGEAVLGGGRSWPHETCGTFLADTCGMVIIICSLEHYFADCVDNSKGTLEHSMVDLPGSLQAKRIEGGRSVHSFVLPSFVRSRLVRSLARSLERIEKRNAAVPDLQFGGDGWLPHGMVG